MIDIVHFTTDVATALPMAELPDGDPIAIPGIGEFWTRIIGVGKWIALGVAVLGLIFIGGKMAFDSRRGETTEEVSSLIKIVIAVVVISGGATILSFVSGG